MIGVDVMKPLTLSIVIPAYNEETYLGKCLDAIANQTVLPDEVIVVDNNSTDKTAEIVKNYPFVRLLNESKQGLFHSRQTGMQAASGDIVGRIDADAFIEPGWIAAVKAAFVDSSVAAATGPVGYHDMPLPNVALEGMDKLLRLARVGRYEFLMGANMALRRSAWEIIQSDLCHHSFLFEDIDIAIHLQEHGFKGEYIQNMKSMVSARRFADNPKNFIKYIKGHSRTHNFHGKKNPGAYYAEVAYTLFYFGLKPLHMAYDPELRRPTLTKFLTRQETRPDPMNVK